MRSLQDCGYTPLTPSRFLKDIGLVEPIDKLYKIPISFKVEDIVFHSHFGLGMVKKVNKFDKEDIKNKDFKLTVYFEDGKFTKKVLSSFVQKI